MRIRTRITTVARERGSTAAQLAERLGLYRSNLSAMDSGRRTVSLALLTRIAELLECSPIDLIEVIPTPEKPIFRSQRAMRALEKKDLGIPDGTERGWVHQALLAWQRHYAKPRLKS